MQLVSFKIILNQKQQSLDEFDFMKLLPPLLMVCCFGQETYPKHIQQELTYFTQYDSQNCVQFISLGIKINISRLTMAGYCR